MNPKVILNQKNISSLPKNVKSPQYSRNMENHICHIGVGGFHRSHQAVYLDELLKQESVEGWGILGVGMMAADRTLHDSLSKQDGLYTVISRDDESKEFRVVGSILKHNIWPDHTPDVLGSLCNPSTKIISLTITEKGYCRDVRGHLDLNHPLISKDRTNPEAPQSAIGLIAYALKLRKEQNSGPVTILSCDNLPENGHTLEMLMMQYIEAAMPELLPWVKDNTSFPNSMVDRITPVYDESHKAIVAEAGITDECPILAEPFRQWVIEDRFVAGRPAWEKVGALFVDDVEPFELMKIRLLNGSHSALSYLALLLGYSIVHEAMNDQDLLRFMEGYYREVSEAVPDVPGVDLPAYTKTLVQRFQNPHVRDEILRLAMDGSQKMPNAMKDVIVSLEQQKKSTEYLAKALAGYILCLRDSEHYDFVEPMRSTLEPLAKDPDPTELLKSLFGEDITHAPLFISGVAHNIERITADGLRASI